MKVTILGSGGSGGVPLLGGDWGRCNPANPKNRRRRVSVLVESDAAKILIESLRNSIPTARPIKTLSPPGIEPGSPA